MVRLLKWLFRVVVVLALLLGGALWAGFAIAPPPKVSLAPAFYAGTLPQDLDAWLATREGVFSDITPGAEKRILWAGEKNARTKLAVIYLHGFSATSQEIRPLPDDVAKALGANLYFTRLAGHGRDGAALAGASARDWLTDLDEALAIGRRIGDRTLLIGTSTGGTLAALAATDPARADGLAGVVFLSPNFALRPLAAKILDLPYADIWGPGVAGAERSFIPQNDEHAKWWTTRYPTAALFPLAELMRTARAQDFAAARVPALFIQSPDDQVVDPGWTARVADAWGGPVQRAAPRLTPQDDPFSHVIAGAILSPNQTAPLTAVILDWAAGL